MRLYIAILALGLLAGCGDAGSLTAPSRTVAASRHTAFQTSARPGPVSCTPGGEAYAARIQGFPDYADTTFYYAFEAQDDGQSDLSGSITHPLVSAARITVSVAAGRDTCRFGGVANELGQASRLTIFPDGTKYARWQLTGSRFEADLVRGYYECDWLSLFETTYSNDLTWAGELLPHNTERNAVFRKGGWTLVVNEEDLRVERPVVNALHLYGPGHREVIVSHVRAIPICP